MLQAADQQAPARPQYFFGHLLHPVLAAVGLTGLQPSDRMLYPRPTARTAFRPSQLSLPTSNTLLLSPGQADDIKQFPGRQGSRNSHAAVHADDLAGARYRSRIGNDCDRDMPASGAINGDAVGLDTWWYRARPAEPHPADFRHLDLSNVPGQAPHVPLLPAPPCDPEPFIPLRLAPRRPAGRVARVEESGHCLGEVPQRLLLYHLRTCGQPRILRPCLGELPTLLQVAANTISAPTDISEEVKRRFPQAGTVGSPTPRSR